MFKFRMLGALALCLALAAPVGAAPKFPTGNYQINQVQGTFELFYFIVKLEQKGDKPDVSLAYGSPRLGAASVQDVSVKNDVLRFTVKSPFIAAVFEFALGEDAKMLRGSWSDPADVRRLFPASLTLTEDKEITLTFRQLNVAQFGDAAALASRFEKKEDTPAAFVAGLSLLQSASRSEVKPADVTALARAMDKAADGYGPAWQLGYRLSAAEALVNQDAYAGLAREFAQSAEKALPPDASVSMQTRVYGVLVNALKKGGDAKALAAAQAKLEKLEEAADKEYLAKVPPFKPEVFGGRKGTSDRVAVFELFTGAQCPPCVAADVAFDALLKTYKTTDVVLIQYHLHIPGPDPMTNPDTEARWAYYRNLFPKDMRGVPSSLFNGKPEAGGGGGMTASEAKYRQYRGILERWLEEKPGAKVAATTTRSGSQIDIVVEVSDCTDASACRLRLLLLEENIRYLGGNGIRFHHNVVRAMPGTPQGFELKEGKNRFQAQVNLDELQKNLSKYLDDSNAKRPFPNINRPLDFKGLSMVAIVQNDKTGEILNAVQVKIGGETASK